MCHRVILVESKSEVEPSSSILEEPSSIYLFLSVGRKMTPFPETVSELGFSLNELLIGFYVYLQIKVPAIPSILKPKRQNASQQPEGKYGSTQICHVKPHQSVALLPPPTTGKQVYVED